MRRDLSPQELAVDLLPRCPGKVAVTAVLSDSHGPFSWGWAHPFTHAEVHAISRANPKRLPGSTITVVGQRRKSGNAVYALPCQRGCMQLIMSKGIKRIEFRDKEGVWQSLSTM